MINEKNRIEITLDEAKSVFDSVNIPSKIHGNIIEYGLAKNDMWISYFTKVDLKNMSNTAKNQKKAEEKLLKWAKETIEDNS